MTITRVRLLSGRVALNGAALDLGASVMFATITNNVVTAVAFGTLPANTGSMLYVDLSPYAVLPLIDWYFSDVCQTFSATAPVIPAGDIAPPYSPGTPPPIPGSPEYPLPEVPESDNPTPLAILGQAFLSFHADGVDSVTATGDTDATVLVEVSARYRTNVRLQDVCGLRLQAHVISAGDVDLVLAYYDDIEDEWIALSPAGSGPFVSCSVAGTYAGTFTNVDPLALLGDNIVSVCARGNASATVGNIVALLLMKVTEGECPDFVESVDGCAQYPDADFESTFGSATDGAIGAYVAANANQCVTGVIGADASPPYSFSSAVLFNGNKALAIECSSANNGPGVTLQYDSAASEQWFYLVASVPGTVGVVNPATFNLEDGWALLHVTFADGSTVSWSRVDINGFVFMAVTGKNGSRGNWSPNGANASEADGENTVLWDLQSGFLVQVERDELEHIVTVRVWVRAGCGSGWDTANESGDSFLLARYNLSDTDPTPQITGVRVGHNLNATSSGTALVHYLASADTNVFAAPTI